MIEIKLSQGAKPGHGGILPGAKVTQFIDEARGVDPGADCISPAIHSAFDGPQGLIEFVKTLRDLCGGKPVGFKLCVGHPEEIAAIVQAMLKTGITPDFITVDGGEGGTGAAPPEYSNHMGTPLIEGLTLVHNLLLGAGLRDRVKIISAGKIHSGFTLVKQLALGADLFNAARAMMFALGCIQALKCNTNKCPTGVTTQDPKLIAGLDVPSKSQRVYNFQKKTVETAMEIIGSIGLDHPINLERTHVSKRIDQHIVLTYAQLHPEIPPNSLIDATAPDELRQIWIRGMTLLQKTEADKLKGIKPQFH